MKTGGENLLRVSKKKIIIAAAIAFALLFIIGGMTVSFVRSIFPNFMLPPARLTAFLGQEFSQTIEDQINTLGFVDFDEITDFEWSHLMIVTPYQDPWQMLEANGIRRQRIDTGIWFSDVHNLLVFLNGGRVVAYINLSRGVADFRGTIANEWLFERANTTFFVFAPESVWGWSGAHLAHWDKSEATYFPLRSEQWRELVQSIHGDENSESIGNNYRIRVEPLTDPFGIARHELSRALFPFAPSSYIQYVPTYEEGTLPDYIVAEIVSLSLLESQEPPQGAPQETIAHQNYSSGELFGVYTGTLQLNRFTYEPLDEGWWAVVTWWQGVLYLIEEW